VAGLGRVAAARPGAPPGEAAALAEAFRELRSGGDAASALRSLEQYDRRFPAGVLRSEARIARAEALIALGRRAEALPLLEGLEGERGALTRNVRITRGELLAEGGHCARAVRDFDALLASPERDEVGGRALYGRASCHLNAGEVAPARRDLERYLLLYPDGDLAAAARGVLDRLK
jgi:tetratricopeptide (TPR) repeat protein